MLFCADRKVVVVVADTVIVCTPAGVAIIAIIARDIAVAAWHLVAGHQPREANTGQRQRNRIALYRIRDRAANVAPVLAELIRELAGDGFDRKLVLQIIQRAGQSGALALDLAFDFFGAAVITCHRKPPSRLARHVLRFWWCGSVPSC